MGNVTNFKVGDKVRVTCKDEFVPEGTVLTVARGPYGTFGGGNYYFVGYPSGCILGEDLELVAPQKPTKNQRISALESEVATLKAEVEALKKAQQVLRKCERSVRFGLPILTPNQKRKAIIDEAKAFVETEGNTNYVACHYEYHVNVEKRTVVALRIGNHSGTVRARGIAKCAPDDVFNADIGKAIALGRALGLGVERFEQAVKPTEFAVGQTFEWDMSDETRVETITEIKRDSAYVKNGGWFWLTRAQQSNYRIIDDTGAKY